MFATFGSNNLLCIEDQTLDTGKKYQQNFQGYMISDKNKLLFVVHKKEIKLIELKNIGDTMGVFYTTHRKEIHPFPWEKTSLLLASQLFKGRDEQQGNHYFFLPYFSPKATITTNTLLKTLGISFQLIVNEKGVMITSLSQSDVSGIDDLPPNKEAYLSFLFGLTLLYGKFEAKGSQLNNIKIHLPLFGHYLSLQDPLEKILCILQQEGIFLQSSHNAHQGKISFQITSNDWELLQIFAYWYKEIENFSQITKKGQTAQIIEQLLIFLQQEHIENAAALETLFKESVVKLLVK